mgnify:FL=1
MEISLNLLDIKNTLAIIAVCSKRGVFESSELSSVGTVVDKLSAFVAQEEAKHQESQETEKQPSSKESQMSSINEAEETEETS